jgi:hypothetical protein
LSVFYFTLSAGLSAVDFMLIPIKIQMAPLAQCGQVLWATIHFIVFVTGAAIGMSNAQVGHSKHHD